MVLHGAHQKSYPSTATLKYHQNGCFSLLLVGTLASVLIKSCGEVCAVCASKTSQKGKHSLGLGTIPIFQSVLRTCMLHIGGW